MICPYCGKSAEWVENKEVYGANIGKSIMIWLCRECDASVGCHLNTRKPFGTMANAATRKWRKLAHSMFDPIWKDKHIKRDSAYGFLKRSLGFDVHIGESNIKVCKQVVHLCNTDEWFIKTIGGK